jgi:hypothetical protein
MAKAETPKDTYASMTVRIPCDLSKRLKYFMIDHDITQQDVVIQALEAHLAKHKAGTK